MPTIFGNDRVYHSSRDISCQIYKRSENAMSSRFLQISVDIKINLGIDQLIFRLSCAEKVRIHTRVHTHTYTRVQTFFGKKIFANWELMFSN